MLFSSNARTNSARNISDIPTLYRIIECDICPTDRDNDYMLTLKSDSETTREIEVRRSRFIAYACRADSSDAAHRIVNSRRTRYPDARHHCSAYVISQEGMNPLLHSSDDGEPSGTAGPPILQVISHSGLSNLVVVVTRYFGGTLLGTGGLTRAYSDATAAVLDAAPKVSLVRQDIYQTEVSTDVAGKVEAELRAAGFHIDEVRWGALVDIKVVTNTPDELSSKLSSLLRDSVTVQKVGSREVEM
ncbi:YigZ family protein [Actinomycetaceae bacterium WB03_NA08]|uniref:YigZ family protein n=2 Tax=Scrofimicrobium canadense TaxID=2652290 RepID=A0A6N7VTA8_9ACTO|nr:YigZ family protein [Scrofimicrobium canadense]